MKNIKSSFAPLGVPLEFNWSIFILLGLLVMSFQMNGFALFGILLSSLIAHEYSHVWMAQRVGLYVHRVLITMFGGAAFIDVKTYDPNKELKIAVAGPIASILLAAVGFVSFKFFPNFITSSLFVINLALGVFNMLPLYPMDGGRVFHAIVYKLVNNPLIAINITTITTTILGAAGFCAALYYGAIWVAIILAIVVSLAWAQRKSIVYDV